MILSLTQEQRNAAQSNARAHIAGMRPTLETTQSLDEYPRWLIRLSIGVLMFILVALFLTSAMRVYDIAHKTFYDAIADNNSAVIAGMALVLGAELGQVAFMLLVSVLPQRSTIALYTGALLCTVVALAGNIEAAQLQNAIGVFPYVEAIAPPVLVLLGAYALERVLLQSVAAHHAKQVAYTQSLAAWNAAYKSAHTHNNWMIALAQSIREQLHTAHQRKQVYRDADNATLRNWVIAELKADAWAKTLVDSIEAEPRLNGAKPAQIAAPIKNGGEYTSTCDTCGKTFTKATKRSASMALTAHQRKHKNEVES